MAKSRRGDRVSGCRAGERPATRTGTAAVGASGGKTDQRRPFLLLQAVAGTALLGFAVAFDSLPVVPVLAFVLFVGGLTVLPDARDHGHPDRRRY